MPATDLSKRRLSQNRRTSGPSRAANSQIADHCEKEQQASRGGFPPVAGVTAAVAADGRQRIAERCRNVAWPPAAKTVLASLTSDTCALAEAAAIVPSP